MTGNEDILKHLTETIKVLATITQSLQTVQDQVKEHSSYLVETKSNNVLINDRMERMSRILLGDGSLMDSISSRIIRIETSLAVLENQIDEMKRTKVTDTSNKMAWNILIITVISGILTALMSGILSGVIEIFKK